MKYLFFIRSTNTFQSENYFDTIIDVNIYGDIEGYKYYSEMVGKAILSKVNIHLEQLDLISNTMRVVILPPSKIAPKRPRLRFAERIIYIDDKPKMEFIIYGNHLGYEFLKDCILDNCNEASENPDDHFHLDDYLWNKVIVKRSLGMTITAPFVKWDVSKLLSLSKRRSGKKMSSILRSILLGHIFPFYPDRA